MGKMNLGRVVGRDGGFGGVRATYVNDGGAPDVEIEASGSDTAKEFDFKFKNLVRNPMTTDEVDRVAAGETVDSSNVATASVMSVVWSRIKNAFAPKKHEHDASEITTGELEAALLKNGIITKEMLSDGCVTAGKLADESVGKKHLDKELAEGWESLSQISFSGGATGVVFGNGTSSPGVQHPMIMIDYGGKKYGIMINFVTKAIYCVDYSDRTRDFSVKA